MVFFAPELSEIIYKASTLSLQKKCSTFGANEMNLSFADEPSTEARGPL